MIDVLSRMLKPSSNSMPQEPRSPVDNHADYGTRIRLGLVTERERGAFRNVGRAGRAELDGVHFLAVSHFYCKERCSHPAAFEENHIGATCRERLHICRQSLPLCTRESALDGRQIVEVHRCDQMKVGRTPRGCNRTLADLILSETGDFLHDRNVRLEVVFVKSNKILRILVHHHESSHCVTPYG